MNPHQRYLLGMLSEIHELCMRNGIEYCIAMGTLLGAVRNRGFLPWDDDLDIVMTYENWERFKEVCASQIAPNRFLGSADLHECYKHVLPRYVSRDTTAIHMNQSLHGDVAGEVIDIFVLDPIADGAEAFENYLYGLHLYSMLVNYSTIQGTLCEIDPVEYESYLERMHVEGQVPVACDLEKRLARNFDPQGSRYGFRWQGVTVCFDRSWFQNPRTLEFEGVEVLAPSGVTQFLTRYYGEQWYEVPPKVNPAKHAGAFSLEFPYTEALEFYKPTYDCAKLMHKMEVRRLNALKRAPETNRLADESVLAKTKLVEAECDAVVAARGKELASAVERRDVDALFALVGFYVSWQTSPDMVGRHAQKVMYRLSRPIAANVSALVREGAVIALMGAGRLSHASRLFEVWELRGFEASELLESLRAALAAFREGEEAFQEGAWGQGLRIARELVGRWPFVQPFALLACACARMRAEERMQADALEAFEALIEQFRSRFPQDGAFIKFEADALRLRGYDDQAREKYLCAAELTRNGLVLLDIFERTGYHPSWLRKASWARSAGVEQWDAEEPSLPKADAGSNACTCPRFDPAERALDSLKALLGESICAAADAGATVIADPWLVEASRSHALTLNPQLWRLRVRPQDFDALASALGEGAASGRSVAVEQGADGRRRLHYYERRTVSVDLDAKALPSYPYIGITIEELHESGNQGAAVSRDVEPRRRISSWLLRLFTGSKAEDPGLGHSEGGSSSLYLDAAHNCELSADELEGVRLKEVGDLRLPCPNDVDGYVAFRAFLPEPCERSAQRAALVSTAISYDELLESCPFIADYHCRKSEHRAKTAKMRKSRREFQRNFDQIRLAVELKSISLKLSPRKDLIIALSDQGDVAALKRELKAYLACIKKYEAIGDACFDDEIYEIACRCLEQA